MQGLELIRNEKSVTGDILMGKPTGAALLEFFPEYWNRDPGRMGGSRVS